MMPDPTFTFSEANRRIADARTLAAAERLARGTSVRPEHHGVASTIAAAVRRLAPAPKPSASEPALHAAQPR